jgi:hypothetical protein
MIIGDTGRAGIVSIDSVGRPAHAVRTLPATAAATVDLFRIEERTGRTIPGQVNFRFHQGCLAE